MLYVCYTYLFLSLYMYMYMYIKVSTYMYLRIYGSYFDINVKLTDKQDENLFDIKVLDYITIYCPVQPLFLLETIVRFCCCLFVAFSFPFFCPVTSIFAISDIWYKFIWHKTHPCVLKIHFCRSHVTTLRYAKFFKCIPINIYDSLFKKWQNLLYILCTTSPIITLLGPKVISLCHQYTARPASQHIRLQCSHLNFGLIAFEARHSECAYAIYFILFCWVLRRTNTVKIYGDFPALLVEEVRGFFFQARAGTWVEPPTFRKLAGHLPHMKVYLCVGRKMPLVLHYSVVIFTVLRDRRIQYF